MARMRVLDLQQQVRQVGRLRMGDEVPTGRTRADGSPIMRPVRLDTFKFTTASERIIAAVADHYGGQVVPWKNSQFAVTTQASRLAVAVPPGEASTTSYEWWGRNKCLHRCDSKLDRITGQPCVCPQPDDPEDPDSVEAAAIKRAELAKLNPPQACSLKTRIKVMIPDLPGLGVWRLDTGSYWAAVETVGQTDLLEAATAQGVMLPAELAYEWRQRFKDGKPYPVPVLEIMESLRAVASGELVGRPLAQQLPAAPVETLLAITAGAAAVAANPAPAPDVPLTAQQIADHVMRVTSLSSLEPLAGMAKDHRCADDEVSFQQPGSDVIEFATLAALINTRWTQLREQARAS